ncbi:protein ANTI-SILENCING 1-like isoform X2 [Tripterygium wilfordii]|uniref:protein ANTI-SILENCING 1-like isoform X2 n=1 Tax=Tripterygium wilfordii TaxID=458696 RepID=UPI0018F84EA5|nr:protein ANTI-SILENCING 1-like isoform X2 [Tripterygium wilfordii]
MSNLKDGVEDKDIDFNWGTKGGVGVKNKDTQFYESFSYGGIEYCLYDTAFFHVDGHPEASIGKIVQIYDKPEYGKIIKVVWFFRPCEIRNFLGDYEPRWNEVFLACGEGKGLSNRNYLESIVQKCNVVCTSNDRRNPKASEKELKVADYFFYRTFDVGKCTLSEDFPDSIAGSKVENFFNRRKGDFTYVKQDVKISTGNPNPSSQFELDKAVRHEVREGKACSRINQDEKGSWRTATSMSSRRQLVEGNSKLRPNVCVEKERTGHDRTTFCKDKVKMKFSEHQPRASALDSRPIKKRKHLLDEREGMDSDRTASQPAKDRIIQTDTKFIEDRSNWFQQLPWEERLQRAEEAGSLVVLENFDPSFTSLEVEELVWHALNEKVQAKIIQRCTFASPHYGKAFVIFKSKFAAESALAELRKRCLMLSDGRVVVGKRGTICSPSKQTGFVGHMVCDISKLQRQHEEMRTAISTSHCSQPNTIEYDLAMDWCLLQEKSDLWWERLHKQQAKEIQDLRSRLKTTVMNVKNIKTQHDNLTRT